MEEIFKMLGGADTGMVAVTVMLCQIIKRLLPSPPQETLEGGYDPWAVVKRLAWVPFASAFAIGVSLSMMLSPAQDTMVGAIRGGLQTGAYSVAAWELWSNAKKLFGG